MKAHVKATFTIPLVGNTGNMNASHVDLCTNETAYEAGKFEDWDLTDAYKDLKNVNSITLKIPSGILEISGSAWIKDEELKVSGTGTWDGQIAGFEGGMSGVGWFTGDILHITGGTFCCYNDLTRPEVYFSRKKKFNLIDNYSDKLRTLHKSEHFNQDEWDLFLRSLDLIGPLHIAALEATREMEMALGSHFRKTIAAPIEEISYDIDDEGEEYE